MRSPPSAAAPARSAARAFRSPRRCDRGTAGCGRRRAAGIQGARRSTRCASPPGRCRGRGSRSPGECAARDPPAARCDRSSSSRAAAPARPAARPRRATGGTRREEWPAAARAAAWRAVMRAVPGRPSPPRLPARPAARAARAETRRPAAERSTTRQGPVCSSKAVLPVPYCGEYSHRIGYACSEVLVGRLDHRGLEAAQEGVGGLFLAERARQRRLARRAQALVARLALPEPSVARLAGLREADVRERVLVPAIHFRLVGQRAQLLQRRVHLLGGAFEEPPAAASEQRIATEQPPCPII